MELDGSDVQYDGYGKVMVRFRVMFGSNYNISILNLAKYGKQGSDKVAEV